MQYTDIDIILPFLKVMRMLTDEDYQQLKKMWLSSQRREAIETLLFVLSRKCPEWEDCFVSALHQSLHSEYGDYHEGHKHILETLFSGGVDEEQVCIVLLIQFCFNHFHNLLVLIKLFFLCKIGSTC